MGSARTSRPTSPLAVGAGVVLLVAWGAPLLLPPGSVQSGTVVPPDAWLLARIVPGVPSAWLVVRLVALLGGAVLLSRGVALRSVRATSASPAPRFDARRTLALTAAIVALALIPVRSRLGPTGQTASVLGLFLPAAILATWRPPRIRLRAPSGPGAWTAAVLVVWIAFRLVTDLGSSRVADAADRWPGFVDLVVFVVQRKNLLTDALGALPPGVGGVPLLLHGVPLFQSGALDLGVRPLQLLQIAAMAVCGAGVGRLARLLVGRWAAPVAVAVFLFAPFTRYLTLVPGILSAGPLYAVALALCALHVVQRRSEAGLAALGTLAGIAVAFPGLAPLVVALVAWTAWRARDEWRRLSIGGVVALVSFIAAVAPVVPNLPSPAALAPRWEGPIATIDASVLGQLSLRDAAAPSVAPPRTDAIVGTFVGALLAPFAHPRIGMRLCGDVVFDPLGAALLAVGVAACLRAARHTAVARVLLVGLVAALAPAFVSPFDVVDVVRALALPVAGSLLAATGFTTLQRTLEGRIAAGRLAAAAVVAIGVGGTAVFDVVNPQILPASSLGILFEVLPADAADRAVVLAHHEEPTGRPTSAPAGPITAFAGPRPVGYFEWDGGDLPAADLTASGKSLFFWSHAFDRDVDVAQAICHHWPVALFFDVTDDAHLSRLHAALVGGPPWWPVVADARWTSHTCRPEPRLGSE